ncbi:MAG: DciA family protein [Terrimesophilobacter sp.]
MAEADPPTGEHRAVFERFRRVFGDASATSRDARKRSHREPGSSTPFGRGRDPHGIAQVMDALTAGLGWDSSLARADLLASWQEIVGVETAEHSSPVGIEEGALTVRCDSTAWATQLRMMRADIITRIGERYPDAGILSIRFDGPGVPSWKKGRRTIPGRGPRDTYG